MKPNNKGVGIKVTDLNRMMYLLLAISEEAFKKDIYYQQQIKEYEIVPLDIVQEITGVTKFRKAKEALNKQKVCYVKRLISLGQYNPYR